MHVFSFHSVYLGLLSVSELCWVWFSDLDADIVRVEKGMTYTEKGVSWMPRKNKSEKIVRKIKILK